MINLWRNCAVLVFERLLIHERTQLFALAPHMLDLQDFLQRSAGMSRKSEKLVNGPGPTLMDSKH